MIAALTIRQGEILAAITGYLATNGYPPSLREIGKLTGIRSTNGVTDHLIALEKKGYIRRVNLASRAIKILKTNEGK